MGQHEINHPVLQKANCYFDNTSIVTRIAPHFHGLASIEEAHQKLTNA